MLDLASEIREQVTMRECLEYYGIDINRANFAQCPFHDGDKTPSLKIYPGNRGWHCFGCDQSGSVIDFVMQYFGEDFKAACIRLNNDFALGLPLGRPKPPSYRERRELAKKRRKRTEARQRETIETDRINENYNQALTLFCSCDYIMLHVPPMSDAWCKALKHMATAKYNLDEAALEVQLLRERKRNNNTGLDS